jgi:hypothetical protein
MFIRAKLICPSCEGTRCRESRWLSIEEKRGNPESNPYRCLDCSHRFLAQRRAIFERDLVVSAPVALLAIVLTAVLVFLLASAGNSAAPRPPAASAALSPEVAKAAEMGDASAQFRVGEALLHDPVRSNENSASAVRWLQLAADNGNTEAMVLLGRLSRSGVGILQDFDRSAKWIQTAAVRGNIAGMLELGRLYRDGVGVDKNLVQAYAWFNRAAAANNLDAVPEREAISRQLTAEELRNAQAQSSAVDAGSPAPGESAHQ